jgi:hypothetical protein
MLDSSKFMNKIYTLLSEYYKHLQYNATCDADNYLQTV